MKKLDIKITKAQLVGYEVTLKDGKPAVGATIALMTEGGKTITTYHISTDAWNDSDKFDLPITAIGPIRDLADILEQVAVGHCMDSQLALGAGPQKTATVEGFPGIPDGSELIITEADERSIGDIHDEIINLDDIEF